MPNLRKIHGVEIVQSHYLILDTLTLLSHVSSHLYHNSKVHDYYFCDVIFPFHCASICYSASAKKKHCLSLDRLLECAQRREQAI